MGNARDAEHGTLQDSRAPYLAQEGLVLSVGFPRQTMVCLEQIMFYFFICSQCGLYFFFLAVLHRIHRLVLMQNSIAKDTSFIMYNET